MIVHLAVFNPITREIVGAETYDSETEPDRLQVRREMYSTECQARGAPWEWYEGDTAFAFPEENAPEEEPAHA